MLSHATILLSTEINLSVCLSLEVGAIFVSWHLLLQLQHIQHHLQFFASSLGGGINSGFLAASVATLTGYSFQVLFSH